MAAALDTFILLVFGALGILAKKLQFSLMSLLIPFPSEPNIKMNLSSCFILLIISETFILALWSKPITHQPSDVRLLIALEILLAM